MDLTAKLKEMANPEKALIYQRFFKIGEGHYGEGDIFLGLTVPESRKIAKEFLDIKLKDLEKHLSSKFHEERLIALFILIEKYENNKEDKKKIFDFYLKNMKYINNWDLVDTSADKIIGSYLFDKDRSLLYKLAKSKDLWEKRISIIATFYFIKQKEFEDTLKISEILLEDKHDLIHKATGWMLREIGKRDLEAEENFLKKHYKKMPRTMLRYAIEKFPEKKRLAYLRGEI